MEAISAEHHISGVYTKMFMEFLVETMRSDQIEELLRGAGETRSLEELADAASWSSYLQFKRLLEERSRLDATGLYQQSEVLSDWLRSWELLPGCADVGLARRTPRRRIRPQPAGAHSTVRDDRGGRTSGRSANGSWKVSSPIRFCDFVAVQYAMIPMCLQTFHPLRSSKRSANAGATPRVCSDCAGGRSTRTP